MEVSALIPAAGRGERMGAEKPFLLLEGQTILEATLERLERNPLISALFPIVPAHRVEECQKLLSRFSKLKAVLAGGKERWESVRLGLAAVSPAPDLVLIHDAVRPLVPEEVVAEAIAAAWEYGAAVAAAPPRDTIKVGRLGGWVEETLDRDRLLLIQTPQVFRYHLIVKAYDQPREKLWSSDDSTLVERLGHPVRVVSGSPVNIKITTPEDLEWARWWVREYGSEARGKV